MRDGVLGLIGNTPLIQIKHIDTGPCDLFVKMESQNPGGSIKDRIGLSMIEAAEKDGRLKPGGTIVEATAGNTGLALALVAAAKGYKLSVVIPDKMSQEKIFHLRALGADIALTRSDVGKGHPDYYQDVAERIAKESGAYYVNQFANPANPLAHETTTGPEIWEQMDHKMDAMVAGVGSGGTMTGLSRFFAKVDPKIEMVLADPLGSILADYIATGVVRTDAGSWLVEGVGEDFIPPVCDLSRTKKAFTIPDEESFHTARELLKKEGILAGSSSGMLVAGALRYCREQKTKKRVVTFICDSGNKYLSKMFNDYWMADQGYLPREQFGDLRDVISRKYADRAVITVKPTDTLLRVYQQMKLYDVSQLPVMEGDKIVGLIDESDVLFAVSRDDTRFQSNVKDYMSTRLTTLQPKTPIESVNQIFDNGMVAIVCDGDRFLGLITRSDMLNYLRRRRAS